MLKRLYAAYEAQDAAAMASLLTDDAFVLLPGNRGLAGTHRGRDESVGFFSMVWAQAPDGFELDIHEVLANEHHGLVIVRVTAKRGADRYEEWETHVHELNDGSSAGVFIYLNDCTPAELYFSAPQADA